VTTGIVLGATHLATNIYEGMFILDSNRYARDAHGVVAQIPATVEQFGGEMLASRLWEERRLAYPVKGQRKGTYWLTYFRLNSSEISNLNRQFQLNDSILRSLVLKIDSRIADAMVQHALTGSGPMSERKAKSEAPAAPEAEVATDDVVADEEE
jgi:small subunit ribosomal protein S6